MTLHEARIVVEIVLCKQDLEINRVLKHPDMF